MTGNLTLSFFYSIRRWTTALVVVVFLSAAAFGQTLRVKPSPQGAGVGDTLNVAVEVSGLGNMVAPSVGTFSLTLSFDPTILSFNTVTFGTFLGDPMAMPAQTIVNVMQLGGDLNALEVSLLPPATLTALQPDTFTLFTAAFDVVGVGSTPLRLVAPTILGDENGDPLTPQIANANHNAIVAVPTLSQWGAAVLGLLLLLVGLRVLRLS